MKPPAALPLLQAKIGEDGNTEKKGHRAFALGRKGGAAGRVSDLSISA